MKTLEPNSHSELGQLLARPDIWQAGRPDIAATSPAASTIVGSGFRQLDRQLAAGGWPLGQFIECLQACRNEQRGLATPGALYLLLPAIRQLAQAQRPVVLVAPPVTPYLPGWKLPDNTPLWVVQPGNLNELLWATEQVLKSNCSSVVISWLNQHKLGMAQLRKLQLAARHSQSLFIALRDSRYREQPSAATLRLLINPERQQQSVSLAVHILKQPGHWGGQTALLDWHSRLQRPAMPAANWPVYHPEQAPSYPAANSRDTERLLNTRPSGSKWS